MGVEWVWSGCGVGVESVWSGLWIGLGCGLRAVECARCDHSPLICGGLLSVCRVVVRDAFLEHNHPLSVVGSAQAVRNEAAAAPENDNGGMPEDIVSLARSLRFGYHPHEIDAMMREIVVQRNENALWDKRHMQHVVRIDPGEKLLDASGFMDLLRGDAYDYRNEEDSAGKLQRAFWPLHSQDLSESLLAASRCVIFDNTFNTSA